MCLRFFVVEVFPLFLPSFGLYILEVLAGCSSSLIRFFFDVIPLDFPSVLRDLGCRLQQQSHSFCCHWAFNCVRSFNIF